MCDERLICWIVSASLSEAAESVGTFGLAFLRILVSRIRGDPWFDASVAQCALALFHGYSCCYVIEGDNVESTFATIISFLRTKSSFLPVFYYYCYAFDYDTGFS